MVVLRFSFHTRLSQTPTLWGPSSIAITWLSISKALFVEPWREEEVFNCIAPGLEHTGCWQAAVWWLWVSSWSKLRGALLKLHTLTINSMIPQRTLWRLAGDIHNSPWHPLCNHLPSNYLGRRRRGKKIKEECQNPNKRNHYFTPEESCWAVMVDQRTKTSGGSKSLLPPAYKSQSKSVKGLYV